MKNNNHLMSKEDCYKKIVNEAKGYLNSLKTEVNSTYMQSIMYVFHK